MCPFSSLSPLETHSIWFLVRLWLYDNALTGSVPTEFGNIVGLEILSLEENALVGTLPEEICLNRNEMGDPRMGGLTILEADCSPTALEVECSCCTCCQNCNPPSDSIGAASIDRPEDIVECTNFDVSAQRVEDQFTVDIVGNEPAVLKSLIVASNLDPFFFNLTEEVFGMIVAAGDRVETGVFYTTDPVMDVARASEQNRTFLMTLKATVNGTECRQNYITLGF